MRTQSTSPILVLAISCLLPLLAACGQDPDPVSSGDAVADLQSSAGAVESSASAGMVDGYYPLEIGNTWTYHRTFAVEIRSSSGPTPPETFESTVTRTIVGTEMRAGREYTVQEIRYDEGDHVVLDWIRYRQDKSGLYAADAALNEPPATGSVTAAGHLPAFAVHEIARPPRAIAATSDPEAFLAAWRRLQEKRDRIAAMRPLVAERGSALGSPPGGPLPEEITRLRYPLRPGASWTVREDPFFGSTVEAMEVVKLPPGRFPAARIRMKSEFYGPNDRVRLWFSRSGELGHQYHLEASATDYMGNVIGTILFDETEMLTDIDLVGPGRF